MALHREQYLLIPTLASYDAACGELVAGGYSFELIVTFDRSDLTTQRIFSSYTFRHITAVRTFDVDFGDLGLSRNFGIAQSQGEIIATADGDDLISRNLLRAGLEAALNTSDIVVFTPEYLVSFGSACTIHQYTFSGVYSSNALFYANHSVSRIIVRRTLFALVQYLPSQSSSTGYAWEDWHLHTSCAALGISNAPIIQTILYYRRHSANLSLRASLGMIAPSSLFKPPVYLQRFAREDESSAHKSYTSVNTFRQLFQESILFREDFSLANGLEPLINYDAFSTCVILRSFPSSTANALMYLSLCRIVAHDAFDDIFLLQSLDRSGATRYFAGIMHSLYAINPAQAILVICADRPSGEDAIDWLPPNVRIIDCSLFAESLSPSERDYSVIKLLQHMSTHARIHCSTSTFATAIFRRYSRYLRERICILYRFCDTTYIQLNRYFIDGSIPAFMREIGPVFRYMCYDNAALRASDITAYFLRSTFVIRTRIESAHNKQPINILLGNHPTHRVDIKSHTRRFLWASRPAAQKRVTLLLQIAHYMARLYPDFRIDVYGGRPHDFKVFTSSSLPTNIKFCGEYASWSNLHTVSYDAFLYTSIYDGIPNVLIEAMSTGLPVIAPAIGGIPEVIEDGVTGTLVPDDPDDAVMTERYVTAMQNVASNPSLARRMASVARQRVLRDYGPEVQIDGVRALLMDAARIASDYT